MNVDALIREFDAADTSRWAASVGLEDAPEDSARGAVVEDRADLQRTNGRRNLIAALVPLLDASAADLLARRNDWAEAYNRAFDNNDDTECLGMAAELDRVIDGLCDLADRTDEVLTDAPEKSGADRGDPLTDGDEISFASDDMEGLADLQRDLVAADDAWSATATLSPLVLCCNSGSESGRLYRMMLGALDGC